MGQKEIHGRNWRGGGGGGGGAGEGGGVFASRGEGSLMAQSSSQTQAILSTGKLGIGT